MNETDSYAIWLAVSWSAFAVAFVILERIVAKYGKGIIKRSHPWRSIAIYLTLLSLSPLVLPAFLVINASAVCRWVAWWLSLGHGRDPFLAAEKEWSSDRDLFLGTLIRRRQIFDRRLRGRDIGDWPMHEFWSTPEAAILEAVDAHRDLMSGGAEDWQIWEKLDTWLNIDNIPNPGGSAISEYLTSRMPLIDSGFADLGDRVLHGHIDMCRRWLESTKPPEEEVWPPSDWLTRQLSLAEFEATGDGARPIALGAPAVFHSGRKERELERLKLRMLGGDELWAFSSPPETWRSLMGRAGVVLLRRGQVVAHVVTQKN